MDKNGGMQAGGGFCPKTPIISLFASAAIYLNNSISFQLTLS